MDNNIEKDKKERSKLLKSYIERLSAGEDLELVRVDFVENFKSVEASEIAIAEQEMIEAGVPVSDVQRLCDVHSALFHGKTKQEQIINAELEVMESFKRKKEADPRNITGHPVKVFNDENRILEKQIEDLRQVLESDDKKRLLDDLRTLRINIRNHYSRKGDLIYPLLDVTYDFSGPSDVMWGVDGEIRDDLASLVGRGLEHPNFVQVLEKALTRAQEMIYKEDNILFPLCLEKFTEEEWMRIYYELTIYDTFLEDGYGKWIDAEENREALRVIGGKLAKDRSDEIDLKEDIVLGSGHMTVEQIYGVLNAIPMELTFIDDKDTNRFFSEDTHRFKRPDMAIGREVHSCHPRDVRKLASSIIEEFRAGSRDNYEFFRYINDEPIFIRYIAVRDENGQYLGTLEAVEELGYAEKHFINRKRRSSNV